MSAPGRAWLVCEVAAAPGLLPAYPPQGHSFGKRTQGVNLLLHGPKATFALSLQPLGMEKS